jgi:hypothetical protein
MFLNCVHRKKFQQLFGESGEELVVVSMAWPFLPKKCRHLILQGRARIPPAKQDSGI